MATQSNAGLLVRGEAPRTTEEAIGVRAIHAAPHGIQTRMHKRSPGGLGADIAAAREWLRRADDPEESAWATFHLALTLRRSRDQKNRREGEQYLRQARSVSHETVAPAAAAILGLVLERRGQRPDAKAMFEEALASKHAELTPIVAAELGSLLISEKGDKAKAERYLRIGARSADRDTAAGASIELAFLLLKRGNDAEAAKWYRNALKSDNPQIVRAAANNLGALFTDRGAYRRAMAVLKRAADAGSGLATFNLGALELHRGNRAAAEQHFYAALGSEDTMAASAAATKLGIILLERNEVEAAESMLRQGIKEKHPDEALARMSLGMLLRQRGEAVEAERYFRQAIKEKDPRVSPIAAVELARLLRERGKDTQAKQLLEEAVASKDPNAAANAAVELGDLLRRRQKFDAARKAYELALGHEGEVQLSAVIGLTAVLREQEKLAEADAILSRVATSILSRPRRALEAEAEALQLVEALLGEERLDDARAVLSAIRGAKKATSRSADATQTLIARLRDQGRQSEAEDLVREWAEVPVRSIVPPRVARSSVGDLLATGGLNALLSSPHEDDARAKRSGASMSSVRELLQTGGWSAISTRPSKGKYKLAQRPRGVLDILASGGLDLFLRDP
jgi:Tfp pilus assembly protein PilF